METKLKIGDRVQYIDLKDTLNEAEIIDFTTLQQCVCGNYMVSLVAVLSNDELVALRHLQPSSINEKPAPSEQGD